MSSNGNQLVNTHISNSEICSIHNCPKEKIPLFENSGYWSCPICANEEELKIEEREIISKQERLESGIPKKFKNARLSDFDNILPVIRFVRNPEGFLFIYGGCGVGKTHLTAAVKYHFNTCEIGCTLIFTSDLFIKLRNSFSKGNESESDIITSAAGKNLVIFDDVAAQKLSDYAIEAWYNIIDRRYREELPTIFTSNLNLEEISKFMTDRLASRLASGIVFRMQGPDKRIKR